MKHWSIYYEGVGGLADPDGLHLCSIGVLISIYILARVAIMGYSWYIYSTVYISTATQ